MHGLVLNLMMTLAVSGADRSYDQAFARSQKEDRPLLVLVGAEWCPACKSMKQTTMPKLEKSGKLNAIEFAQVDIDDEPQLGQRLMNGTSVPQLILFTRRPNGWARTQLNGAQAERDIEAFLRRAVANHVARRLPAESEPMARQASAEEADNQNDKTIGK